MISPLWIALATLAFAQQSAAQSPGDLHLRRLLAVPLGALPPMGQLMLASRDHNYWVGRIQAGTQWQNLTGDQVAVAGGIDLQWRGGSVFGVTAGYSLADCDEAVTGCASHPLFGGRAKFNILTGGPTFAALVGDNSATTTLGAELGLGYAPNAVAGRNACAFDIGLPVSVSFFQRVRLLSFFTPGIAWDARCIHAGSVAEGASTYLGAGIGLQQLGHPGLDVSVGMQRIFRRGSGFQLGVNVTYVRLP
jgi:hypothetical protein